MHAGGKVPGCMVLVLTCEPTWAALSHTEPWDYPGHTQRHPGYKGDMGPCSCGWQYWDPSSSNQGNKLNKTSAPDIKSGSCTKYQLTPYQEALQSISSWHHIRKPHKASTPDSVSVIDRKHDIPVKCKCPGSPQWVFVTLHPVHWVDSFNIMLTFRPHPHNSWFFKTQYILSKPVLRWPNFEMMCHTLR